jgi:SAM-dependent methyltransferase
MEFLNLKEINSCEICGNTQLKEVLNLGLHPMCDDLVEVGDSRECKEYPIEILYCEKCYTAHQKYQIPKSELFPKTYHYRSRFTADVLNGMADLVASCKEEFGDLKDKKILDIGCNDGSLLDIFRTNGAITFGIEPTGAFEDALIKGHEVINEFLTIEVAEKFVSEHGKMDFICFTNVFAHIEDLSSVIEALKRIIGPTTVIVIENHYLGAVLDGLQFDTFYHEHPRTYSYQSFVYIAKSLGLGLLNVQFPSRYGGNIRVYMGNDDSKTLNTSVDITKKESNFLNQFLLLVEKIELWKTVKKKFIKNYNQDVGKLKAKAFPGRAAILVKLLGLTENEIESVFEKPGSMKIGHYLPGTKIPIKSDDDLFTDDNKDVLIFNLAWHIHDEIEKYLRNNGLCGEIVDILTRKDLK